MASKVKAMKKMTTLVSNELIKNEFEFLKKPRQSSMTTCFPE
jgi:hypothetical protein